MRLLQSLSPSPIVPWDAAAPPPSNAPSVQARDDVCAAWLGTVRPMTIAPPTAQCPTFLVGAERSGTTMLRLMLESHPALAWMNEFEYAVDLLPSQGGWPPPDEYRAFLATHRIFRSGRYLLDPSLPYPDLVKDFLEQRRARSGKPFVGATVHRHFDRLLRIWPDAGFLHLVRDPRDVARSCVGMGWAGNVWTGARRWIEAETLWDSMRPTLSPTRFLEIRYEDLVQEPEAQLRRICDFLSIPWTSQMLSYTSSSSYEAPDPALIAQWRQKLGVEEIRLVEARVGSLLSSRGYPASGLPALEVGAALRARLRVQDRIARARYAIGVFGLGLRMADAISRRLGLRSWQRRIQLRKNEILSSRLR